MSTYLVLLAEISSILRRDKGELFTFHQFIGFSSKVVHRSHTFLLRDLYCRMSPKHLPLGSNSWAGSMLSETLRSENSTV